MERQRGLRTEQGRIRQTSLQLEADDRDGSSSEATSN
jgi:hypothetical protein